MRGDVTSFARNRCLRGVVSVHGSSIESHKLGQNGDIRKDGDKTSTKNGLGEDMVGLVRGEESANGRNVKEVEAHQGYCLICNCK